VPVAFIPVSLYITCATFRSFKFGELNCDEIMELYHISILQLCASKGEGKVPGFNEVPRHKGVLGERRYNSTHS